MSYVDLRNSDPKFRAHRAKLCQEALTGFQPVWSDLKGMAERNQRILEYCREGLYTSEIAEKIGVSAKTVQKVYRRYNFPKLQNLAPPRKAQRPQYKAEAPDKDGYIYVHAPDHPNANYLGKIRKHRLVMSEHLGRPLTAKEVVHHIDDDVSNNDISNLELFPSNAEHLRKTLKGKCPNWSEDGKKKLKAAREKADQRRRELYLQRTNQAS